MSEPAAVRHLHLCHPVHPASSVCWRPTTRSPQYLVSCQGQVRRADTGRLLKPCVNSRGYLKVCLGRQVQVYVHQLVCEAFLGSRPSPSHEVDHLDWDRCNNAVLNLRWLTRRVNCVRWEDRVNGRNVWSTPDEVPEAHHPLDGEEREQLHRDLEAAGW